MAAFAAGVAAIALERALMLVVLEARAFRIPAVKDLLNALFAASMVGYLLFAAFFAAARARG